MPSDRRLHPVSLVLNLGKLLWDLLIPAVVVLFAARSTGGSWQAWLGLLLIPYAGVAVGRYLTFRFRYEPDELVVRSGVLFRTVRHVPYARIQNLDARQNLIHRWLGVAEVRVETGAGLAPEAVLSVLALAELAEMRRRVFAQPEPAAPAGGIDVPGVGKTLLHLPVRELMLAGLIENRGMVLILAFFGVVWESGIADRILENTVGVEEWGEGVMRDVWGAVTGAGSLPLGRLALMAVAIVGLLLGFRLISIAWAAIRLHDFRLTLEGEDLRTEYGLFTRVTATVPLRRIQTVTVREGLLHRPFRRVSVRVATAGGAGADPGVEAGAKEREWVAPILRAERLPELFRQVQPGLDLSAVAWQPPHPGAARRVFRQWLVVAGSLSLPAALVMQWRALAVFAAVSLWGLVASRLYARHLRWATSGDTMLFRSGWLSRHLTVAPFGKIQAVAVHESPFDRRTGMAGVEVDTAGAAAEFALDIPYLPRDTARVLGDRLVQEAGARAFRW